MKKIMFTLVITVLAFFTLVNCAGDEKKKSINLNEKETNLLTNAVDSLKKTHSPIEIDINLIPADYRKITTSYIFEYDSCEYIIMQTFSNTGKGFLSHKGNCKYCAEREKKMIKEVVKELLFEHVSKN